TGESGVDDVADAGNGETCFGNVGGDDDFAEPALGEDAFLFGGGEAAEERDDFDVAAVAAFQEVAGFADVSFAGHEDENVAANRIVKGEFDGVDGGIDVAGFAGFFAIVIEREINGFDGKDSPRDFDNGSVAEGLGESLSVDGGAGDDDFEVVATGEQREEMAE